VAQGVCNQRQRTPECWKHQQKKWQNVKSNKNIKLARKKIHDTRPLKVEKEANAAQAENTNGGGPLRAEGNDNGL